MVSFRRKRSPGGWNEAAGPVMRQVAAKAADFLKLMVVLPFGARPTAPVPPLA